MNLISDKNKFLVASLVVLSMILSTSCTRKKGSSQSSQSENTDEPGDGSDIPGSTSGSDEPGSTAGGSDEPGDGTSGDGSGGHSAADVSGLYMGYLSLPGKKIKIAAEAYFYVVRGPEITDFPIMNVLLKLQPGGFGSNEYTTDHFEEVHYSYEQKTITLDNTANNLMVSGKVEMVGGKMRFQGKALVRNSSVTGTIDLEWVARENISGGSGTGGGSSDEPGDGSGGTTDEPGSTTSGSSDEPGGEGDGHTDHIHGLGLLSDGSPHSNGGESPAVNPFPTLPKLGGQYTGSCNGYGDAILQVATGRNIESDSQGNHSLKDYRITAQLAVKSQTCGGKFCTIRQYEEGAYDFFTGKLILQSEISDDQCLLEMGVLACKLNIGRLPVTCNFNTDGVSEQPFKRYKKMFEVNPTADEKTKVPAVTPPVRQEVLDTLSGNYSGFLHHERLDRYQRMNLDVLASISSINPHNNDVVYVTANASLFFGPGQEALIQKMDRTSFDLALGFALFSPDADGFLIVQTWTKSYIRGIWVSHSFGKVGIVELVKGRHPELPPTALTIGSPVGYFNGNVRTMPWELNLVNLPQASADGGSLMLQGMFRDANGNSQRNQIAQGAYDFYAEHIALLSDEDDERMIVGKINSFNQMELFWPGSKQWGITVQPDYIYNVFNPRQGQ